MDIIKATGADCIALLQGSFLSRYGASLHRLAHYSSPVFVLTVLCPAVLALQGAPLWRGGPSISSAIAIQLIWTSIVGLRLNNFRQWHFGEDRPYWWVMEAPYYSQRRAPYLQHYPVTCVGTPAAPSRSLLEVSIGVILAAEISKLITAMQFSSKRRQKLSVIAVWLTYIFITTLIALSEILFAAHFPHQVIISMIIGLIIGVIQLRSDFTKRSSLVKTLGINLLLLLLSLGNMLKSDAVGSFNKYQQLAFRWCLKREWMEVDTAPLLDAFVYSGFGVGTAIAVSMGYFAKLNKNRFTVKMVTSALLLNLLTAQAILWAAEMVPFSAETPHIYGWYLAQLLSSILVPICCGALVPYFVQRASGVPDLSVKRKKT